MLDYDQFQIFTSMVAEAIRDGIQAGAPDPQVSDRRHLEMMAATCAAGMTAAGLHGHHAPACSSIPALAVDMAEALRAEVRSREVAE